MPASVSTFSVLSSCQVMCSRPGTLIKRGRAVGSALLAGGFVLRRIPGVGDACGFGRHRKPLVVAFGGVTIRQRQSCVTIDTQ